MGGNQHDRDEIRNALIFCEILVANRASNAKQAVSLLKKAICNFYQKKRFLSPGLDLSKISEEGIESVLKQCLFTDPEAGCVVVSFYTSGEDFSFLLRMEDRWCLAKYHSSNELSCSALYRDELIDLLEKQLPTYTKRQFLRTLVKVSGLQVLEEYRDISNLIQVAEF